MDLEDGSTRMRKMTAGLVFVSKLRGLPVLSDIFSLLVYARYYA